MGSPLSESLIVALEGEIRQQVARGKPLATIVEVGVLSDLYEDMGHTLLTQIFRIRQQHAPLPYGFIPGQRTWDGPESCLHRRVQILDPETLPPSAWSQPQVEGFFWQWTPEEVKSLERVYPSRAGNPEQLITALWNSLVRHQGVLEWAVKEEQAHFDREVGGIRFPYPPTFQGVYYPLHNT